MDLIEFENLPSTNTPLSAENLNNNFNVLETSIHNIEINVNDYMDYVDNLGNVYTKSLPNVTGTLQPNAWRTCCTNTSITLPAGTYLFIATGTFAGTSSGSYLTMRTFIDSSDNFFRSSIYMRDLTHTTQVLVVKEFSEEASHTLNIEAYNSGGTFTCSAGYYTIIKLK